MFVEAIKKVSNFTRPIHTITRNYGDNIVLPGAATMFFVNELGVAITCKHVASIINQSDIINQKYLQFKDEEKLLTHNNKFKKRLRELEQKYGYKENTIIQIQNHFMDCVDKTTTFEIINHPLYDLSIIKFNGYDELLYKDYAVFIKDENNIQQGKYLCRLGYPFPEFSNFKYNKENDDIERTSEGQISTPRFPIDGIITRKLSDNNEFYGIEISTPGLKGQSGGPLFDMDGKIYGIQYMTNHLHLGFDMKNFDYKVNGKNIKINNQPFLHVGRCVAANIIKQFLRENNIKYYEEE